MIVHHTNPSHRIALVVAASLALGTLVSLALSIDLWLAMSR